MTNQWDPASGARDAEGQSEIAEPSAGTAEVAPPPPERATSDAMPGVASDAMPAVEAMPPPRERAGPQRLEVAQPVHDAPEPRPALAAAYRRRALGALERARLQGLCDRYVLEVRDRRANDSYVAALVRARRLDFSEVLHALKREELQAVCDELELDRSGREKEVLVERILRGPPPVAPAGDDDGAGESTYMLTARRKREALGVLGRDRLARITSRFELQVHDQRVRTEHISAITRKRSLPFAEVLKLLTREELKEMCAELELPENGREKRVLIERILGEPLLDHESGLSVGIESNATAKDAEPEPSPRGDDRVEAAPKRRLASDDRIEVSPKPTPSGDGRVETGSAQELGGDEPVETASDAAPRALGEFALVARARRAGVLDGKSALIVAPTATGKSTLGRMAVQWSLQRNPGRLCVYLVPFRALAWELYEILREDLTRLDTSVRVRIATGDATDPVDPSQADVIVGTYESFAGLHATHALEPALLVVDEIHMLADETRGPPLEMLLSHFRGSDAQLCGLSAVIDEPEPLADWLGVDLVRGSAGDRAVPVEFAVEPVQDLDADLEDRARQALQAGQNVLVFCHTKAQAEVTARALGETASRALAHGDRERLGRLKVFLDAPESDHGDERLMELVPKGVAYHHAGLVRDVRREIERAYREGALKVIASTPTLAAGVNLPAQLVLLKGIHRTEMQRNFARQVLLPVSEVLNMLGRAGRPGQATSGRGIVLIKKDIPQSQRTAIEKGVKRGLGEAVHSRMGDKFDWILRLMLRETAERERTQGQLREALMRTLWYREQPAPVEFDRELRDDLMEDIPTFQRADGLELIPDSVVVEPDGVTGAVRSGDHQYQVSIRLESFDCSCPSRQRWHRQEACKHLARAIHDLLFGGVAGDEARYRAMVACLDLFRKTLDLGTKLREALKILEHWRLVDRTATGFRATPAGRVAAWSGLDLLLTVDAFRRVLAVRETSEPREIALWTVEDFFGDASDRDKWRTTLVAWLDEVRTHDVPLPTKHRGDFERTRENLVRVIGLYVQVARAIGNTDLERNAETAAGCLRHGVRPDALPLAALNIPELRRGRCRYLIDKHGIASVDDLAQAIPGFIADQRRFVTLELCEQWVSRARAIRDRRASARSVPEPQQPSAFDDLFARFRVEPIALRTP